MPESVVVHRPYGPASSLLLLFHGVGSSAENLVPVGEFLAAAFPLACIVSVDAPNASDMGPGRQWFSVRGVTEENRAGRVQTCMPRFQHAVGDWQRHAELSPEATVLLGFSQGAIMALESTQLAVPLAARVVSICGRFAVAPHRAPERTRVHLVHGEQDPVIPVTQSIRAAEQLAALGASVSCDVIPGLGHGIDSRVLDRVSDRLREASLGPAAS
jgi:phospholipase/carboxylesterase